MLAHRNKLVSGPLRLIVFAAVAYAFCWVKGWPRAYDDEELPPSLRSNHATASYRVGRDQLVVSVLTTATDVYTKAAPAMVFLDDADHGSLLHFGDLQMTMGRWPVFDVLAKFPADFIHTAKELAGYRRQLDHVRRGIPLARLQEQDPAREKARLATLNKYKVLQAMDDAWRFRPNRTWYAFVDDDAFLDRTNLLDWLSQHDGNATHFFGNAAAPDAPDAFAAGGTSFVLSGRAMKELLHAPRDVIRNWTPHIAGHGSALALVSDVVQHELGLPLQPVWPGMSGFAPSNVPFGPYALWCEPVMALHRVPLAAASTIWRLQTARADDANATGPFIFAHLWDRFLAPQDLNAARDDWDNLSSDATNARWNILFEGNEPDPNRAARGETSWEACQASCNNSEYCVQWSYSSLPTPNWNENTATHCHLSTSIRLGAYAEPAEVDLYGEKKTNTWKSGWRKAKFQAWAQQATCKPRPPN